MSPAVSVSRKPVVGISLGDPCGIGPEVTARALRLPRVHRALRPVVFGDAAHRSLFAPTVDFVEVSRLRQKDRRPGKPTAAGGTAQLAYVDALIEAAREGRVQAMCTAPVSKEQITRAGVPFMGHTERLAEAFGVEVLMMMDGPRLKVALATNHLPLSAVPGALDAEHLSKQLQLLSASLQPQLRRRPRLAVCGLNPHAGEGGLLGTEEVSIIAPAVAHARARKVDCHGPFPADGLFAQAGKMPYDAVLAMFHDQALVAAKALDFARTVNVTLGLPVPRTSPDHGVAYALAGQERADCQPMAMALLKAAQLAAPSQVRQGTRSRLRNR